MYVSTHGSLQAIGDSDRNEQKRIEPVQIWNKLTWKICPVPSRHHPGCDQAEKWPLYKQQQQQQKQQDYENYSIQQKYTY